MAKPTNFDYAWFKKNKPSDLVIDPKTEVNMTFLHVHYIHYPKLDKNSKVEKVMYDRVNDIRQMTAGLKKTRQSVMTAIANCKLGKHDKFKLILHDYLELLRTAEMDRQNWIKIERGLGNTNNVDTMLVAQGLDDFIRV